MLALNHSLHSLINTLNFEIQNAIGQILLLGIVQAKTIRVAKVCRAYESKSSTEITCAQLLPSFGNLLIGRRGIHQPLGSGSFLEGLQDLVLCGFDGIYIELLLISQGELCVPVVPDGCGSIGDVKSEEAIGKALVMSARSQRVHDSLLTQSNKRPVAIPVQRHQLQNSGIFAAGREFRRQESLDTGACGGVDNCLLLAEPFDSQGGDDDILTLKRADEVCLGEIRGSDSDALGESRFAFLARQDCDVELGGG
ncbi:hypothetical protein HG530_001250 [Fusarium avenaceum]|nr:hypothetical protein HG530_001250 [Fusarium avenaceum]